MSLEMESGLLTWLLIREVDRYFRSEEPEGLATRSIQEAPNVKIQVNYSAKAKEDLNQKRCTTEKSFKENQHHGSSKMYSRLETRAALSFSVNVLPFWLFTFPITLGGISLYWCVYLQVTCPFIIPLNRLLKNLFIIHLIYNPVAYVLTTREFQRAFARFMSRFKTCSQIQ